MSKSTPSNNQRLADLEAENARLKAQLLSQSSTAENPLNQNSGELLDRLLEASSNGYLTWNADQNEIHYSDNLWTMLGYQPGDYDNTPQNAFKLLAPEDRQRVFDLFAQSVKSGEGYDTEAQVVDVRGVRCWIRIQTKVFAWDETGRAQQIVGAISNIDDLKILQQKTELQRKRASWINDIGSELFEKGNLSTIRWSLSQLGKMLHSNRAYLRMLNAKTDAYELVAEWHEPSLQPLSKILSEDEERLMQRTISRLLKADGVYMRRTADLDRESVRKLRRKMGAEVQCGLPLFFNDRLQGCLVITSKEDDIWDRDELALAKEFSHLISLVFYRQKVTEELSLSQERFRYAMEATQDGLWDINLRDGTIYVSRAYFGMLGYAENELNEDWDDYDRILHPDDFDRIKKAIRDYIKGPDKDLLLEYRMQHKNGDSVWVMSRGQKMDYDDDGQPGRVIGLHTNITDYKNAMAKLDAAMLEAKSANLAKSEFLARMSHEIRTPMNAILGMSHLALGTELSGQQKGYLTHIDDAAKSLLSIIDDILDFSKIEAGKLDVEKRDFDFSRLLSRLSNLMMLKAEQKGIDLVFHVEPEVPLLMHGDETRLSQVLINFLSNAVKFTKHGGVYVHFSGEMLKENHSRFLLRARIEDTGIGISEKQLQGLFDPFSQADESVTRRFGGTGLGLTICKHLVELMEGKLEVISREGRGSCFSFELPLSLQPRSESELKSQANLFEGHRNVAVVDACDHSAQALEKLLIRFGAKVVRFDQIQQYENCLLQSCESLDWVFIDGSHVSVEEFSRLKYATRDRFSEGRVVLVQPFNRSGFSDAVADEGWVSSVFRPVTPENIIRLISGHDEKAELSPDHDERLDNLKGMKVLLAEDNLVNQKVAAGILRKRGVEVVVANNGLEALETLDTTATDFDAILMDMEMPKMDGYQATQKIREGDQNTDIPIIAMTAHAMKGDREKCLEAGMDEYLTKPINPSDLYFMLLAFKA